MSMFTKCLRSVAYVAIGVLMLAFAQSVNAQGCRGGGGGGGGAMGYSQGGMGGGMMGGSSYMGGTGSSYGMMGNSGMGQSYGMMGGCRGQNQNSTGSQNYSSSQQTTTSITTASVNNPSTVLAYTSDLNLTAKQVQLLNTMLNSGKQHAALVLTQMQRKQLIAIIGPVRKSKST